ncbi:DUF2306 domain-containing protein [Chryseobacterium sp. JK1]|uniref:DUF2306 domain-containing protein n=1 Tax=Chryseobacterium sp. JK1 TaxID=874294 RepID=UPI003D692AEE
MKKIFFVLMSVLALLIGIYPIMYAFVELKYTFLSSKSPVLLYDITWKTAFFAHIIFGGISLFIGWRQFGNSFREKHMKLHQLIGKIYVGSVTISSVSAIYMGFYANGGMISAAGFICLGIIWLFTTFLGVIQIQKGQILKHQQLMTYSYACTFAAVTLRLWYPLLQSLTKDPSGSYTAVAWLCWVPNLLAAYCINQRKAATT